MKRFEIAVTHTVVVNIDPMMLAKLMPDFNACINDFGDGDEALEKHARHIARLAAEGFDFEPSDFVEGYGLIRDAGIRVTVENSTDIEILSGGAA